MVMLREQFPKHNDGSIDLNAWLHNHCDHYSEENQLTILHACQFSQISGQGNATVYGQLCFEQGLECAEILTELHTDATTVSSAIIFCSIQGIDISLQDIEEHSSKNISQLVAGLDQMSAINTLHQQTNRTANKQIDNLRKMLLAMVADVRIVLITLAIRVCHMRGTKYLGEKERKDYAIETMDVYAPLANRLGISNIKWQLEDLAFINIQPDTYLLLAKQLNEKRITREQRVKNTIHFIQEELAKQKIKAIVAGRAKHIYSIYKKMQRKNVSFQEIYDTHAIRVIVDNVKQCYATLSMVHSIWTPITEEFDDYISTPKPNGYQSIHTAVIGPNEKHLEIQIRTHDMHNENEMGGAAHWLYKEGVKDKGGYESKIIWLRELLEWHKLLSHDNEALDRFHDQVFEDRVYVFTPEGDIIDLPKNSTPLDFAYHIHSEIGHRCKGAKANKKMVPLTYQLKTGDRIEIITAKEPHPSRDWINPDSGYLASPKARTKVHHWFKKQDIGTNIHDGKLLVEKEFDRLNLHDINFEKVSNEINYRDVSTMYAGLACGNIRISQIVNATKVLYPKQFSQDKATQPIKIKPIIKAPLSSSDIQVSGISNLLTTLASCCKPIPGEDIIGYITRGRGVSIHCVNCKNMATLSDKSRDRLIDVNWSNHADNHYIVDLAITTDNPLKLTTNLGALLANDKIQVLQMTQRQDKFAVSISLHNISELNKIIEKVRQLPSVTDVKRSSYYGVS